MVQRIDDSQPIDRDTTPDVADPDDRLGEAIEEYLAMAERDQAPDLEEFLARHEDMKDDLRAAMEGLELVHGLVGRGGSASSGSGRGAGPGRWLESGHRIAGYRVVRELGRGGMGTVYEAVHVGLDRPVALKVLGTHAAPDSSARRRFLNEAKTAAGLHHTHIVPVFDVGQVGGLCYYAMQRIEGSGLDRVIRHLRRSRASGSGPAGSSSSLAGGGADAGSSSFSSRFGQIWLRVSPGWLWRQPRHVPEVRRGAGPTPSAAWDRPDVASAQARSGLEGIGVFQPMPVTDSTASWGSRRPECEPARRTPGDPSGSAMGLAAQPALHATEAKGCGDEPPPFDPPRGSAYFRWVAALGLQSADALAHAHHQGVIHRDVKPSNLLIDAKGNIWVTDFGLARRLADPGLTHHDSLLGTPRYMSPEQARTAGNIDGRTDVYSLGATLYELLTLRPPFDGQSAAELIDQIGRDDPVPPRKFEPRVPRDLETIVLKALAKRPADRYATAAELAEDLARFLSHAPVKARRIGPVGRLWRVARRHPQIAAVTTAAAATILAIATYAHMRVLHEVKVKEEALSLATEKGNALEKLNRKNLGVMRTLYLQTAQILDSSDVPDRRGRGLDLLHQAVELGIPRGERSAFRDEAVKFLVLRDVETGPKLMTGPGNGLRFGPQGHRLSVLSDDNKELAFWDLDKGRLVTKLPLRDESAAAGGIPESAASGEDGERPELGRGAGSAPSTGTGRARAGEAPAGHRRLPGQSLALAGNAIAALLPDDSGVLLIDALSGTPLRKLTSPGRWVLGVIADPAGRRLVTIEQSVEDRVPAELAAMEGVEWPERQAEYSVNLWDLDHVDRLPVTVDPWPRPGAGRPSRAPDRPPLVALSPDGRTIAIAPSNGTWVRLFSIQEAGIRPRLIDTQTELSALALGPNALMAVAGGGQVRLYDTDRRVPYVTTLKTSLNVAWLLRFSPLGTLAVAGWGPIELWDPAAQVRIAVLTGSEWPGDVAFAADGRTLAAVTHAGATSVWTVQDSATRTQLSGFDARPSSVAFGRDGVLVGGGWDGEVWTWRSGRCPEACPPLPLSVASVAEMNSRRTGSPSHTNPRKDPTDAGRGTAPGAPASGQSSHDRPPRMASSGRGGEGRNESRMGEGGPGSRRGGGPGPTIVPPERPTAMAFDAEGRLVVHGVDGVRVWPAGTPSAPSPPVFHELPLMARASFHPPRIARTPDGRIMAMLRSSSVYLWRSHEPDRLIPVVPPGHDDADAGTQPPPPTGGPGRAGAADTALVHYRAIQIAPAGDRIYLVDLPGRLHIWDIAGSPGDAGLRARKVAPGLLPDEAMISGLALRPDGAVLAVRDRSGTVTLLDIVHRTAIGSINPAADESVSVYPCLAFSPDGRILAVGAQQGAIALYAVDKPAQPQPLFRLPGHRPSVRHLAFDASGSRLASAGMDPLVEVWDLDLIRRELAQRGLAADSP